MAPYTTTPDIQSYYLGAEFLSTSDYLTPTVIDRFIAEKSTIIDFAIKKKYTLPITDANDLTFLKVLCEKLVVCQVDKILRQNSTPEESDFRRERGYCKKAKEMLDKILNGDIELNTPQKSFKPIKYNKTEVSTDGEEECRL